MKLVTLALVVASTSGFAPAMQQRTSTELYNFLDGVGQDPASNMYSRGGKNSWEFEQDTMYVAEEVSNPWGKISGPKKKAAAPKAEKPAAAPKKKSFFGGK